MLLKITHETELKYDNTISESVVELRMFPRQEAAQHRLSFELKLQPYSTVNSYFDWLGNTVHTFTVNSAHDKLRVIATSVVETEAMRIVPETLPDTWPLPPTSNYSLWDFVQFDGPIVDSPHLRELAKELFAFEGINVGELAMRMIRLINSKFEYQKGITTAASPVTDTLKLGKGVCQDFTHLMIALARSMGIPARYVSGLLHADSRNPEGLRGFTQSHAWCELFFPSHGWLGFDPTNNTTTNENFVKVAVGRDYRDVPPNKGMYRGQAKESMIVNVRTDELHTIPADLFPEKIMPLGVATSNGAALPFRRIEGHHQEHAMQQQQEKNGQMQQQQQQ